MKTLALIYASEGTGHKSAAFALREAFLAANPEGNALCLDILDFVPPFMKGLLSGGYDVMARSAPWLWSRFYWGSDKRGGQASAFEWVHGQFCRACLPKLRRHLASKGAEAAIFTHYFGAAEFAAMNRGRAPVYYADTDFETHRFQRSREFTMSFAGSARAARQRMAEGITNVIATGVPVALKYARIPSKAEARAALGLPAGEKTSPAVFLRRRGEFCADVWNGLAVLELLEAVWTDVFAVEVDDILGIIAENTGGLIFLKYNGGPIHIDLQGVLFRDIQSTTELNGQNDTAKLIHFSDNTG